MSVDVGSGSTKSEPNVVPLCDILLVLLIIFMVITPVMQKGIDIKLPESGGTEGGDNRGIVLTIEKDLTFKINQEKIDDVTLLENRLMNIYQTRQDKTIFIRADENVTYRDVLRIIDVARGAGIEVLGIIPERYQSSQ